MGHSIEEVIASRQVRCLFQPIVDATNLSLLGYEALSRGPSDCVLHSPVALFEAAAVRGLTRELDYLCLETAAATAAKLVLPGRLFLNLTPTGLLTLGEDAHTLVQSLEKHGRPPEDVVFELTERAILDDYPAIRKAMQRVKELGVCFAIDDLGAGYSGLRAWSELAPEFVKIDRYFISSIDSDPLKMEFVRAIVDMARAARSTVIAEGVATQAESTELREAGVGYLQGYHIARPKAEPMTSLSDTLVGRIQVPEAPREGLTAIDLANEGPTVTPDTRVVAVADMFHQDVTLQVVPVVRDGRALGIVRRTELLDVLSLPLRTELYRRKDIEALMDRNPLLVESDLRLDQVSRIVTRGYQERLHEQFLIVRKGVYVGMGRVIDLLKAITEEQVQMARYSNPLTTLPGNVPIYDCINGLIRRQRSVVLCHIDVDSFKPFNDCYSYSKGDEALIALSGILTAHASPRIDFVGHLGGDDFVVVFRSNDWQLRVEQIFSALDAELCPLYSAEHIEQGGITVPDRYGVTRKFPLLSISVAAIVCDITPCCSAEELAYLLAPLKSRAKREPGNAMSVELLSELVGSDRISAGEDVPVKPDSRQQQGTGAVHVLPVRDASG